MAFLADTHVHVYPGVDAGGLLDHAHANLSRLAGGPADLAVILTERQGHRFFRDLGAQVGPWTVHRTGSPVHHRLTRADGAVLHLLAGRQIACRERLEVLALLTDADLPDGEPIRDTLRRAWDAAAFPVIPWSPGKWLGARGRLVRQLLTSADCPGGLGDILLRPGPGPRPAPMRHAATMGFPLLAGTDPLPLAGQEAQAGRYASRFDGPVNLADLPDFLRRSWLVDAPAWSVVGQRGGWLHMLKTLRALSRS